MQGKLSSSKTKTKSNFSKIVGNILGHPNAHMDAKTWAKSDRQATSIVHTYNAVIVKDAIKWGIRILSLVPRPRPSPSPSPSPSPYSYVAASWPRPVDQPRSCPGPAATLLLLPLLRLYQWPCMCAVYFKLEHSKQKCLSQKREKAKDTSSRQSGRQESTQPGAHPHPHPHPHPRPHLNVSGDS